MHYRLYLMILLMIPGVVFSQSFSPAWESLDNRMGSEWFDEAKFGIMISWGVYSVPAYHPVSFDARGMQDIELANSEDYIPGVMYKPGNNDSWHKRAYGDSFEYFDFASLFRAELFNPAGWADLFYEAGAKYIVMNAKHAEGFAMWPEEDSSYRFFNSGARGPGRDLLMEMSSAFRQKGFKTGYYYSLSEYWTTLPVRWNNRLRGGQGYYVPGKVWNRYHIPAEDYVARIHSHVKQLVTDYHPDLLWFDREWDYREEDLKIKNLLAWIYNQSPEILVNDRLAIGSRMVHGDFHCLDGNDIPGKEFPDIKWERKFSIGNSYGYNRAELLEDYKSSEELIRELVKTVAAGGNFLLTIGPRADGTIPLIYQMRLKEIGAWLKTNGEAIYGSRPWSPYLPVKTVNPRTGDQIFFTEKGEDLYVFLFNWNINAISLKELGISRKSRAYYLQTGEALKMKVNNGSASINLPFAQKKPIMVLRIENAFNSLDD